MSLVAGPGRGGAGENQLPDELKLVVEKHVAYIQSLDSVRTTNLAAYLFVLTLTRTVAT